MKKNILTISIILNIITIVIFILPTNTSMKIGILIKNLIPIPLIETNIPLSKFKPKSTLTTNDIREIKKPKMPVIETHGHVGMFFNINSESLSKALDELNIEYFINLSFTTGSDFIKMKSEYNDKRIIHFSTFNWKRIKEADDFVPLMLEDLKKDISNGTKGIKLWKDFGLIHHKKNGDRLRLNDPILDPLFQECEKNKLIISIHTADPKVFFQPIDMQNERLEELYRHPDWSFSSSKYPKFEEVMKERDELFSRHPSLIFISLHLGEYSDDLPMAKNLLTNHPNVYIDIAARIDELGRQPYSSKIFITDFQDRIVFGTDGPPDAGKYEIYSRFLETKDEYFDYYPAHKPRKGFWKIYGLGLENEVLEKIYSKNAHRIFKNIIEKIKK